MQKHPLLSQVFLDSLENPHRTSFCIFETEAEAQEANRFLKQLCAETKEVTFSYLPGFMQTGVFKYESTKKVLAKRLQCTFKAISENVHIIVTTSSGLSRQVPDKAWFEKHCIHIKTDSEAMVEELEDTLHSFGYSEVEAVEGVGEFAVRGSILDVWSPANEFPLRIEFFGDSVEAIRWFRTSDQKSFENHKEAHILPCREFVWPSESELSQAIDNFNNYLLKEGVTGQERGQRLENLKHSVPFPGVDDIYPTFVDMTDHTNFIDLLTDKKREIVLVKV